MGPADLFENVDKAVQATIRAYCGWHIAPAVTETFIIDGSGGPILLLPTLKLTSILSAKISGELVSASDLEWSEAGMVRRAVSWPKGFRSVELEVTHGYQVTPAEVVAVANRLQMVQKLPSGSFRVGSVSVSLAGPNGSSRLTSGDSYCDAILDRFVLPVVS